MEIKYRRRKNLTVEEKVAIVTDYNADMSIADIKARYSVDRDTIYRILRTMAKSEGKKEEVNAS